MTLLCLSITGCPGALCGPQRPGDGVLDISSDATYQDPMNTVRNFEKNVTFIRILQSSHGSQL